MGRLNKKCCSSLENIRLVLIKQWMVDNKMFLISESVFHYTTRKDKLIFSIKICIQVKLYTSSVATVPDTASHVAWLHPDFLQASVYISYEMQGWCGILIFDKYTYLASFWYLSLYKYPKYTYEHPKYTYYQNILMKRVSVQKYPKGGPLEIKWKHFINISFYLRGSYGILECWKGKRSPEIPHLLWSPRQTEYPKNT